MLSAAWIATAWIAATRITATRISATGIATTGISTAWIAAVGTTNVVWPCIGRSWGLAGINVFDVALVTIGDVVRQIASGIVRTAHTVHDRHAFSLIAIPGLWDGGLIQTHRVSNLMQGDFEIQCCSSGRVVVVENGSAVLAESG